MSAAGDNSPSLAGKGADSSGGAAGLYRSPTWARNINFDTAFDVNLGNSSDHSGYVSPAEGPIGVKQSGLQHIGAPLEGSVSKPQSASASPVHSRNGSILSMQQQSASRKSSSHTRQGSNPNMTLTSSQNSPTTSTSERTTPKTSHFPKSTIIPSLPAMHHQRNPSTSSANAMNEWSRPSESPQLHSSADIYASNAAVNDQNRNSASLSMMSGTSLEEIDDERRDSGADSTMAAKRASVLSFQTALSGMGGGAHEESHTPELDRLEKTLPQRPWLNQPTEPQIGANSSFSTSPDERHLPGSWGNGRSAWNSNNIDDTMPNASRHSSPLISRSASAERMNRSPAHSPKMKRSQLDDITSSPYSQHPLIPSSRGGSVRTSPTMRQQASLPIPSTTTSMAGYRHGSLLRHDATGELLSQASPSHPLSPISGEATTMHGSQKGDNESSAVSKQPVSAPVGTSLNSPQFPTVIAQKLQPDQSTLKEGSTSLKQAEIDKGVARPALPAKTSPPSVPAKDDDVGLSSPPMSDNIIPSPLPSQPNGQTAVIPESMPADRSPVLEFRRKPLMNMEESVSGISKSQLAQRKSLPKLSEYETQASSSSSAMNLKKVGPGVGAHAMRSNAFEAPAGPAFAAHMRGPSDLGIGATRGAPMTGNNLNPTNATSDRSPSPTVDTPPREDSPPPEGEVEARAEWERAQLRRAAEREKKANLTSRKSSFKTQLKPLQLVTAEETKRAERKSPARDSIGAGSKLGNQINDSPLDEHKISPSEAINATNFAGARQASDPISSAAGRISPIATFNNNNAVSNSRSSSGGLSTQQLQRQVARDQRYSVNAVNIALGQKGVSDIGGAYPVFQSPSTSAVIVTGSGQKYSGLMPQRSLVPPFELQNRPDGLPSALIGPDGVRRSPNDPEVCLECMMRDEDMIDVHVLGAGLWERESDRDFEEAIRLEAEEDAKREKTKSPVERTGSTGTHGSTLENATASTNVSIAGVETSDKDTFQAARAKSPLQLRSTSPSQARLTKIRVKRISKGDPLTAERLKLHTQMNPPASSHRWRTLQTFLSIQARYIASEQKARGQVPTVPPKTIDPISDNRMMRTISAESKGQLRPRVSSPGLFQVAENPLNEVEKAQKERDIVGAREARRRNNVSGPEATRGKSGLFVENGNFFEEGRTSRLSTPMLLSNEDSTGHHSIPRRSNAGPGTFARGVSAQELRTISNGMPLQNKMGEKPLFSNNSSLAPPNAPFRATSSTPSTPAGPHSRLKSASSQMSLAASGSMIDMHVGLEDGQEHRLTQNGFMPGTPLHSQSPSVVNRAFYGFPGDGDAEMEDYQQGGAFADYDETYNVSRESPEVDRKKKKGGLRSLFSGRKSATKDLSPRLDEEISRDQRERTRSSLGMDSALDLQPPPGIGGLLSRARRSTSSLLTPTGRQSMESGMMLNNNPFMASQTSLELGPFGSGPLPPPRKESRFSQALGLRPESPQSPVKEKSRLRTFSSGNLMSKKKLPPNPSSRSSSMMQTQISPSDGQQNATYLTNDQQMYSDRMTNDRSSGASLLVPSLSAAPIASRPETSQSNPQSRISIASGNFPYSPIQSETLPRESTNIPIYPGQQQQQQQQQSQAQQQQQRSSAVMHSYRANRSEGVLPMSREATETLNETNSAPRRPPRSPRREASSFLPEQQYASLEEKALPLTVPASIQKEQYYHASDAQSQQPKSISQQYINQSPTSPISPEQASPTQSSAPFRKSRLLKLPFGKNKRESTNLTKMNGLTKDATPSLKSQNSRGTLYDLQQQPQQQQHQYQHPTDYNDSSSNINNVHSSSSPSYNTSNPSVRSKGWNRDRQQYNSLNITYEEDQDVIPPRSQSALGVLDATSNGTSMRSFLPRLRTNSRAALRDVRED